MPQPSRSLISGVTLAVAIATSITAFAWPLFRPADAVSAATLSQSLMFALMPILLALVFVDYGLGARDTRQLAVLAVLVALNATIRLLGAGVSGIETVFFLIIIAASVFGSSFGFVLGAGSLLVSALIGAGVGPWLPFQMMAAAIVGAGAGLIPRMRSRWLHTALLALYAVPAAYLYGALMTMWNWPLLASEGSSLGYVAGASLIENLTRFFNYELITGGLLWDTGRAVTTVVLICLTAPALTTALSRAAIRAGFSRN